MKLYLKPDGSVRAPAPGEYGHLDMARTTLGPDWRGDSEDTYAAMWNAGWVRVVNSTNTLVAEQWVNGQPVAFADLPPVQREWLEVHSVHAHVRLPSLEEFESKQAQAKIVTLDFARPAPDAGDGTAACS